MAFFVTIFGLPLGKLLILTYNYIGSFGTQVWRNGTCRDFLMVLRRREG
jgi:hypothetical protein